MGDTVIPFNGNIKSIGNVATIKNDKGTLSFSLETSNIHAALQSGRNIAISSGIISTILTPTFKNVTINNEPSNDTDAVTVKYVNDRLQGLDIKESVALATTANIPLTDAALSVDGVSIVDGYRILVKDQTDAKENGIYVVNGGGWTRAPDFDTPNEVKGAFVFVERGSVNAAKGFVQRNFDFATIGQDDITFAQFNGTYAFEAGDGLSKDGNTLNVDATLLNTINAKQDAIVDGSLTIANTQGLQTALDANTAKVGITTEQASAIEANTAKVGITTEQASAIEANTAKVGITTEQASAIGYIVSLPTSAGATGTIYLDSGLLKVSP